jgi:hypothetical protein
MNIRTIRIIVFVLVMAAVTGATFAVMADSKSGNASLDCSNPQSYGVSLANLEACRSGSSVPFWSVLFKEESAAGYITCLDEGLERTLIREVAESQEEGDELQTASAIEALDVFRQYCRSTDEEFASRMQNLEQELLLQVDQISTFLWMRTWELDFITYLLDDTGFNRAYFSDDIWTEIKTGIEKNNRRQWFYDQRALVMAYDLEPTLEQLDGYQWQYEGKVRLSARTEDDRKKEAIVPVKYVFGSNPLHASDINPGGFYVTDLDIDLKTAFDQIYEALPIVKNSEKPDISGGDR